MSTRAEVPATSSVSWKPGSTVWRAISIAARSERVSTVCSYSQSSPSARVTMFGIAAVVLAAIPNIVTLAEGEDWLYEQTVLTRSDLAAIEIARQTVDPGFQLTLEVAGTSALVDIQAGNYLEAAEEHGSPAYTQAELAAAPAEGREQADVVLSQALPLSTESGVEAGGSRAGCATVPPGDDEEEVPLDLRPGVTRIEVPPGEDAELSLRRYATDEFPVPTEDAPAGEVTVLE